MKFLLSFRKKKNNLDVAVRQAQIKLRKREFQAYDNLFAFLISPCRDSAPHWNRQSTTAPLSRMGTLSLFKVDFTTGRALHQEN